MNSILLDRLSQCCGTYISGLKYPEMQPAALRQMLEMELEQYSLEDCNYSLSYLLGRELHFQTYDEIKNYIQKATE